MSEEVEVEEFAEVEPKWKVLSMRILRESAKDVLGFALTKRLLKPAHDEVLAHLRTSRTEEALAFTCLNCKSLIDGQMTRCWACGLVIDADVPEPPIVDAELAERAKSVGLDPGDLGRSELIEAIEGVETRVRAKAARNADLVQMESGYLNDRLTESMPDGWYKKRAKQYTSYFDPGGDRRIAVFHSGLRVAFSVVDGFFDGFPAMEFFDAAERRKRHYGRVNYEYSGDTAREVVDLAARVFDAFTGS